MRLSAAILSCALVLTGCAGSREPLTSNGSLTVVEQDTLPPPTDGDIVASGRPYLIGPYDKLAIDVFNVPEFTRTVQADASGRISVPLIGPIDAAGITPGQLADKIAEGLRGRYVRDPQVTVNLTETVNHAFAIDGEVREPGNYPVVGQMSLMRAIAAAKGTSEFAKLDDVVVFRTVGNQRMAALYNLQAIRRGAYADPEIYPKDVIVVGTSQARKIFKDAMQFLPALATPIVAFVR